MDYLGKEYHGTGYKLELLKMTVSVVRTSCGEGTGKHKNSVEDMYMKL